MGALGSQGRDPPFGQGLSIRYTGRLAQAGIETSVGRAGDSNDNALAESIIGLYKAEVIHPRGPWRHLDGIEYATLEWVDWFNSWRLLEPIGNVPPAEFEKSYHLSISQLPIAVRLKPGGLRENRGGSLRLATQVQPDLLIGITQGLGASTNITYGNLSSLGVYTAETGSVYPIRDVLSSAPITVVTQVTSSNGIGGTTTNTHTYGGGRVDTSGRGFLSFRWTEFTDAAGTKTRTEYNQTYPYAGLPKKVTKTASTGLLVNQSESVYTYNDFAGNNPTCPTGASDLSPVPTGSMINRRFFLIGCLGVDQSWELNGLAMPSTRTKTTVDTWGNVTQVQVETLESGVVTHTKTTNNTYLAPNTTNWILGRLRRAQVTSVTP